MVKLDVAASFTDCAARLASLGRHLPAPVLRSRLAWPLAVTAVTLAWLPVCCWDMLAAALPARVRAGSGLHPERGRRRPRHEP
jgi:hypothetical protein